MAKNSIELIREAETEAEGIAKSAATKAEEIIENARQKAESLLARADDETAKATTTELDAAHTAAQMALQKAGDELLSELNELDAKARVAQPAAIKLVLEALV